MTALTAIFSTVALAQAGGNLRDDGLRRQRSTAQHGGDARLCRRHYGQAVRPVTFVAELNRIDRVFERVPGGGSHVFDPYAAGLRVAMRPFAGSSIISFRASRPRAALGVARRVTQFVGGIWKSP